MEFIKPMLAVQQKDAREKYDGGGWIAEPKLDGYRVQLHVENGRLSGLYTRKGLSRIGDRGFAFLKDVSWPFSSAVMDGEAIVGGGRLRSGDVDEGSVGSAIASGAPLSIAVFDLLWMNGVKIMEQKLTTRRALLWKAFEKKFAERVNVVPGTSDWQDMWRAWVEQNDGEGVMVKRADSLYVPGWRNPGWIKVKKEITLDVVIIGVTDKATYTSGGYRTGDVSLTYGFWNPTTGAVDEIGQGLKVGSRDELMKYVGRVAEVLCNGVMPTGGLKHARLIEWRDDKPVNECTREAAA